MCLWTSFIHGFIVLSMEATLVTRSMFKEVLQDMLYAYMCVMYTLDCIHWIAYIVYAHIGLFVCFFYLLCSLGISMMGCILCSAQQLGRNPCPVKDTCVDVSIQWNVLYSKRTTRMAVLCETCSFLFILSTYTVDSLLIYYV